MKKPAPCFFFAVFTMLFLGVFYFTVTNMAGIYITWELGGAHITSVYPMVFYGLGNALGIPLAKDLADRIGAPRLAISALLLYTLFSLFCSYSPTYGLFNFYRFLMGFSAGPFFFLCKRWIDQYGENDHQKSFFSTVSILMFSIAPVLGACFGAILAYEVHWRWIFHCNEPISLFLAIYFWKIFQNVERVKTKHPPFDWGGYISYCLGFSTFVLAATMAQELDWYRSDIFMSCVYIGIPSLIFFFYWEIKHPTPIIHLRLFSNPAIAFTLTNLIVLFSSYFGMIILVSLWLQIYANYTPLWIAALIGTMGIAGLSGYWIIKRWIHVIDPRLPLGIAISFFALSCIYSTAFNPYIDFFRLAVARFLAGFGLVLFLVPLFRLAFTCCEKRQTEEVYVLFQCARTLSSSLGAGIYMVVWQRRQVFYYTRLGSELTPYSQLVRDFVDRAVNIFYLTKEQAYGEFQVYLEQQATSLGLNDTFGLMGVLLLMLLGFLLLSFKIRPLNQAMQESETEP